ncbi:MAG: hypothetical protein ACREJC_00890 [Tepidisphaeraceae bacterium]
MQSVVEQTRQVNRRIDTGDRVRDLLESLIRTAPRSGIGRWRAYAEAKQALDRACGDQIQFDAARAEYVRRVKL